jgi:hypothetical protein
MLSCIEHDKAVEGAVSTIISRIGQQIVDSALLSSREKRTVPLIETDGKQAVEP